MTIDPGVRLEPRYGPVTAPSYYTSIVLLTITASTAVVPILHECHDPTRQPCPL